MTHEEKRTAVRQKIVEACPELMELTNGCFIEVAWSDDQEGIELIEFNDRYMSDNGNNTVIEDSLVGDVVRVIGHQIRLEHVLRALGKKVGDRYCIDFVGWVWKWHTLEKGYQLYKHEGKLLFVDFKKDLSNQPEATVDFLFNVFYTK